MEICFNNKTAVLTGASEALGRAITMLLAGSSADVIIGDALDELEALLSLWHLINASAVCSDIVRTDTWEQLLDEKMVSMNLPREEISNAVVGNLAPVGRPQTEEDIAVMPSNYADNFIGSALNADGSQCMQT